MQFILKIDCFLGISSPKSSFWSLRRWNFKFKSMIAKKLYDANIDDWSNYSSSWNCCIGFGSACGCVYGVEPPKPSSMS